MRANPAVPSVSVSYARAGNSTKSNAAVSLEAQALSGPAND